MSEPPEPPRAHRGFPVLGLVAWLGLTGLLVTVGAIVLGACGLAWPGGGAPFLRFCPEPEARAGDSDALLREQLRSRDLEQRLDALRVAIWTAPDCVGPHVVEVDPPVVDPDRVASLPDDAGRRVVTPDVDAPDIADPDVTGPDVAEAGPDENRRDTDPPDVDPPDIEPPEVEPPEIPEEEWEEQDVSFLEGCWNLITDYRITRTDTGEVFDTDAWEMCFDGTGTGNQSLTFGDLSCEGGVRAQFSPDGALTLIDRGNIPCDNGSAIDQRIMECERLDDGTAQCETRHTTPPFYPVPVGFQR